MPDKRIAFCGDLHCGHVAGLTPPEWCRQGPSEHDNTMRALEAETWLAYRKLVDKWRPLDALVVNGDAIDGKGVRSGGTEQLEADRRKQCDMAKTCISAWDAPLVFMTFGTGYHTGNSEDWESVIANEIGASIKAHQFIEVNGVTFSAKHKVGSSSVPHGRHTAVARESVWNAMWADRDEQPRAQVLIRSHVHYHAYNGDARGVNIILPALQAAHTKFGGRQCSGTVDWGIVVFEITAKGNYTWTAELYKVRATRETSTAV